MRMWSAWRLWSRFAGQRAIEPSLRAAESDDQLTRALRGLQDESERYPSWNTIERLILTGEKERSMAISRTAMFAFSRKAAVIAATSFVVLLAFFTVPFSQTSELGANIIFKFDPPLDDAQARCDQFANAGELLGLNPDQESPTFAMVVKVGEGGLESLEVTALAEGGLTADEVIAKLQSQYPFLAQATVTINPIMEYSESTLFGRLLGDTDLRIECEGKTAEEIKAEIEAILAGRGLENPKVEVIKTGTEGPTKIKISAPAGCCKK